MKKLILVFAVLLVVVFGCAKSEDAKPIVPENCTLRQCMASNDGINLCPNWTKRCNLLCDTHKDR